MKKNSGENIDQQAVAAPLAIVGIGSLFPQADNTGIFWSNIKSGVDTITEVPETHWRSNDYFNQDPKAPDQVYAKHGGFLSPVDFNPMEYGILPNALEAIDTSQLLGLVAVEQALRDAGYSADKEFDREKVSVILGVTGTLELVVPLGARLGHPRWREALKDAGIADAIADDVMQRIADTYVPWQENSFPGLLGNVVAGRISKHFDFGGTNCVVDAACGSSLSAINLASLELAAGKSDMVITGGIDTFNDIFMYACFSKTPALSPSGHARPFDAAADGTTLGEGLGIVVLKRLSDAERDGDKIYAVIKGVGSSSDGRGAAIYEPSANGQQKALQRAYAQAAVGPETIELIEAHGTGTKVGDAVEVTALREVFGVAQTPWCAIGSIKSQIGHTKAAAGSAGIIKATLALYHKVLPPTIKVTQPQDILCAADSPFYVNTAPRPWIPRAEHPRRAGVSALGFGGSNFHCLLEEYQAQKPVVDWSGDVQIAAFSAADRQSLTTVLRKFAAEGSWSELRLAAADSRNKFDADLPLRLTMVIEKEKTNRPAQIKTALTMLEKKADEAIWSTPDGCYFSSIDASGSLAMLFPGQGAQYTDMLKDLMLQFPSALDTLAAAERSFAACTDEKQGRLSEKIYPRPSFDSATTAQHDAVLQATENAQPALGAVSLAAKSVLSAFGVTAEAYAGHSYGELTALCAGGVLDQDALCRLSRLRGELMAAGEGDRGSMLAVSAPLKQVEAFLAEQQLTLVIANRNTPEQAVLSGAGEEIDKAASLLEQQGMRYKKLAVSAAFHSALVADASGPFAEELREVTFGKAMASIYANTSGKIYPAAAAKAKQLLAEQLAKPVDFVSEIENMYKAGIRTFVEVGPGARLTGMVKAILGAREHQAFAVDSSNGQRSGTADLARVLAQLTSLGYSINLALWDEGFATTERQKPATKKGLTVPLCGANHFKPPAKRPPLPQADPSNTSAAQSVSAAPGQPVAAPAVGTTDPSALQQALQITQQSMQALQSLQEQTSRLHQQFLEGQEAATRSFMNLVEQQRSLLHGGQINPQPVVTSGPIPTAAQPAAPSVASVPTVEPAAAPQVAATVAVDDSKIAAVLLGVIAEKTGYPTEMLELEMALDTDLGIDSIKRVEILSALQEQFPELPAVKPEDLGALQTLGQIVGHLNAGMQQSTVGGAAVAQTTAPVGGTVDTGKVTAILLEVIAEKTGYPVEMLELEMALDTDLGIDSIKRVEILSALQEQLPEAPAVKPEDLGVLQTLGQIVEYLSENLPTGSAVAASEQQATINSTDVAAILLEAIAEKTGYPVEMLELEMALDTDLGIDSIKRVEIFSVMQERLPEAPSVKPEDLGVLQTLGQIVEYLADSGQKKAAAAASVAPQLGHIDRDTVAKTLLDVIAEKTGYPVEMLEQEMALDTDLGIDSIKRVEILSALQEQLPGAPAIKPEHLGTLQTVSQIVDFLASVSGTGEPVSTAVVAETDATTGISRQVLKVIPLQTKQERQQLNLPDQAQIWVVDEGSALTEAVCEQLLQRNLQPIKISADAAPTASDSLAGLIILAPAAGADDNFMQQAFSLLQRSEQALNRAAEKGGALLTTVARLNGSFGLLSSEASSDPLSGGLSGLSKTAAHEWPRVNCKALDLSADLADPERAAALLVAEACTLGPEEVGISNQGLHALKLSEATLVSEQLKLPVSAGDLVVVSGGARGVTAEVAVALAEASQTALLLLGRSPLPEVEPEWLSGASDEAQIKKAIIAAADGPIKPKEVAERYQQVSSNREILATLSRIEAAGGKAIYRSVDLRNAEEVSKVVNEVRQQHGPVRGVIHGAGVLADRLIKDKTLEQFNSVYSTKVDGLRALLTAVGEDDLGFLVMFSSSTGRFGRTGQVDYAVANEILNKLAQQQAVLRPKCRVVSLNWGPWDGGMVTPALKKVFAQEGVAVIDLQAGADYLLREISSPPDGPVELVILGGAEEESTEQQVPAHQNIYISKAFDLDISIDQYPFLKSHVLDGKAVLPMAVIVEWMAHGAIHNNPGLRFHGFNDLRILKGVTLEQGQTHNLQVMTGKTIKSDGMHVVPVELSGVAADGQEFIHARAKIVLASRLPEAKAAAEKLELAVYSRPITEIYRPDRLFHGPDFHGIREVLGCSDEGISTLASPAPLPDQWVAQPLRNSWLADPLVLDSSFQMMILWSFERYQAGSLPVFTARYRQYQEHFPETGAEIRVRVTKQSASKATAEIDFLDPLSGSLVARIEDYECVIDASLNQSFQRNKLQGVA